MKMKTIALQHRQLIAFIARVTSRRKGALPVVVIVVEVLAQRHLGVKVLTYHHLVVRLPILRRKISPAHQKV